MSRPVKPTHRHDSKVGFHACLRAADGTVNPEACRVITSEVACPLCGAEAEQPCHRMSGTLMASHHKARTDAAWEASLDKAMVFVKAQREKEAAG